MGDHDMPFLPPLKPLAVTTTAPSKRHYETHEPRTHEGGVSCSCGKPWPHKWDHGYVETAPKKAEPEAKR